jgi:hypothetical protein
LREADIVHDLHIRPWPVVGGSVVTLLASHILEHFSREEGWQFLAECHRVLVPHGDISIAVPDMDKFIAGHLDNNPELYGNWQGDNLNWCLGGNPQEDLQSPAQDFHRTMYCFESLAYMLEHIGFINIKRVTYETAQLRELHNSVYKDFSLYVEARK